MPPQPKTLDRMLISLKLKKPGGGLTREQALGAWPVRNPALKSRVTDDGLAVIELPRRKDFVGGILGFLFSVPDSKPVELDEVGTFVWNMCDGDHTVNDIITALVGEYKLNRREVEISLNKYLQDLAKRGIVAFAVPREVAEAAGLAAPEVEPEPEPVAAASVSAEHAEPIGDFHPGLAPTPAPAPKVEDTSDFPPVDVEDVLDTPPSPPAPLPGEEGNETPVEATPPAEEPDDQEHPGRV